jgi:hypothetical protein
VMLQTMSRLKTLHLDSQHQAKMLSLFQLEVPRFLHASKDAGSHAGGTGQSRLSKLPTVESWNQGPGSKKQLLEQKLPNICKSFQTIVTNALLAQFPVLCAVATMAFERSVSFSTSWASSEDGCFENTHVVSRMPKPKT